MPLVSKEMKGVETSPFCFQLNGAKPIPQIQYTSPWEDLLEDLEQFRVAFNDAPLGKKRSVWRLAEDAV